MISDRLAAALARRNIHYGWVVAGTTFLVMLLTSASLGSASVLLQPFESQFGWTTEQVSSAFALQLLLYGLLAPFAAALINRFGVRRMVAVALLVISTGIGLSLMMRELWQLVVLWGVMVGAGAGMTALVLGATIATRWFEKRRGLVVGLMTASNATGQLIFLPVLTALTQAIGWQAAAMLLVGILALVLTLALLLLRDRPSDLGLAPYGGTAILPPPPSSKRLTELVSTPILALRDAARTSIFWALFATFFICGFSTRGLVQTHWISICGDVGIAPLAAAGMLAVIGGFDFIGTIASGWLADRYDNRYLLLAYYGLRGLSLLFLPYSGFSIPMLTVFAVFYGLDWVATVPPTVKLSARHFGPEKASLIFGWVFVGHQLGGAAAAALAGIVRTGTSSYYPAILLAGVLCLLAAVLILTISKKPSFSVAVPAAASY